MNTFKSIQKFFKDPTVKSHIYLGGGIFVGLVIAILYIGQTIQGSDGTVLRMTNAFLILLELAILIRCLFLVRQKFNEEMEVRSSLEDSISMVENMSLGRLNQRLSVSQAEHSPVRNLQILLNEVAESLIRDLADRKWQESEYQRYLALINHSTDFIAMFSTEGRLLYVNQTGREMLGLRSQNFALGFIFSDYFSKSSWEGVHHRWSQLKSRGEFQLESSLRHFQTGEIIPTSARYFSVKGTQTGDVLCYATIQSDIRAQKQAEAFIEQHRAIVVTNSKMTALGEMAGGIAHEINNPLIVITGFLDELNEMTFDKELNRDEFRKILGTIHSMSQRISKIVKGLRSFSRDGSKDSLYKTLVEEIVGDTLALCQERFKTNQIRLTADQIPEGLALECRATQISQVLLSLIMNSFDAVEGTSNPWVQLTFVDLGAMIGISVIDSGAGVPPEFRDKVFLPFFTTKEIGKGAGLGLSVAKGIVEAHGGRIELDVSSPVTRFNIYLPKTQDFGFKGNTSEQDEFDAMIQAEQERTSAKQKVS